MCFRLGSAHPENVPVLICFEEIESVFPPGLRHSSGAFQDARMFEHLQLHPVGTFQMCASTCQ